ncbi:hypothetical protein EB796_016230 [Bugula neritina]|uniref:Uncharacterized protein n=1 Tax=Bugula neritina TaxID=10212 RepID=A0A7J7JIK3_BUGNE|nr:hypothetical protein EB796_016230 [Bugula neritina]
MLSQVRVDGKCLTSLYQLKKFVKVSDSSLPTTVYINWFIDNMEYLKELKTNYDQRIYLPLAKLHQHTKMRSEKVNDNNETEKSEEKEPRITSASSVLRFKNDLPDVKDLYDFTEVDNIASRIACLRQHWQLLLEDENEINPTLFSLKSELQLSPQCPKELTNILRLVPDILLKCSTAAALSQLWLVSANSKTFDLETKHNKLLRVKSVLTEKLSGLSEQIKSEEQELQAESTDLELLADREERPNELMSKSHQLDYTIRQLKSKVHFLQVETKKLKENIENVQTSSEKRKEVLKLIHANELQVLKLHQDIQVHVYEKSLLVEDLSIELEVKPCMIRYADQVQSKCEKLEQVIDSKRTEKQKVESALVPVLEDSKRTQDLMSRVNSVEPNKQLSVTNTNVEKNKPQRTILATVVADQY